MQVLVSLSQSHSRFPSFIVASQPPSHKGVESKQIWLEIISVNSYSANYFFRLFVTEAHQYLRLYSTVQKRSYSPLWRLRISSGSEIDFPVEDQLEYAASQILATTTLPLVSAINRRHLLNSQFAHPSSSMSVS